MIILRYLKQNVDWDSIGQYADPEQAYKKLTEDIANYKQKRRLEEQGFMLDFNKSSSCFNIFEDFFVPINSSNILIKLDTKIS